MWLDTKTKIIDFFKKHKRIIFIVLSIWVVLFVVNIILGEINKKQPPTTSYEMHTPIISGSEVPQNLQDPIEEKIEEYMEYCKTKQYDKAFSMISEDCKNYKFANNIDSFKSYVDYIFTNENDIYSIQDYSNVDDIYVYKIIIGEDILATGMNTEHSDEYYEEKIAIQKKDNQELSLSVGGYIGQVAMDYVGEDDYMKIWIDKKTITYENEIYEVKIQNKTDQTIVLANSTESNEIMLGIGADQRQIVSNSYEPNNIVLRAGNTLTFEMKFNKYFDEGKDADQLIFNKIRVLPHYTGVAEKWEEELAGASKLYSLKLNIK